jgi:hypothetical protein
MTELETDLQRQLDEVRDNFAAFLERVGGQLQPDGSVRLTPEGYGNWTKRKGGQRTQEILAENELLQKVAVLADKLTDLMSEFPDDPSCYGEFTDALVDALAAIGDERLAEMKYGRQEATV